MSGAWIRRRAVCLAAVGLLVAGCGPGVGTVDGKLVWADGQPAGDLAGSQVVFESAALKISGRGTVGADGSFTLGQNLPDGGLPPGEYQVAIVESRKNANSEGTLLAPSKMDEKYADMATAGLSASVKAGKNEVKLTVDRAKKK